MAARADTKGSRAKASRVREAPLHELSRDQLSVFLYVALLPEETRALVKELGLSVPGFRTEALTDVERCDVLADEILAHPPSSAPVHRALGKAFEAPPLGREALDPPAWQELLRSCATDAALPLTLWRVLSDRDGKVRDSARPILDELARHYYEPLPEGAERAEERGVPVEPTERVAELEQSLARAEERIRESGSRAESRVEEARRKGEEQRDKLQASLREARARESHAAEEAARAREEAAETQKEAARLRAEVEALRESDLFLESQRLRSEGRDLAGRVNSLESRLERALAREEELEAALGRARGAADPAAARPPDRAGEEANPEVGEAEATFLLPVYTREFYDSLEGWDRRIQRAAFKQAHLLALDHRHPSLRALPLEGLPGYYRVRVATDVRLIYRRAERQNTVEILSLIDREDLDRYIRQAKTRG
ncbi:MAG TPA: hypothetical protein VMK42_15130 [Anaeromyxobacteraceae bacterium]|nr:hypothetical protein [Anaeromyxobacteraceae bacterium]